MSETTTPSGFRLREIRTTIITDSTGTRVVPELDAEGNEIEVSSVPVPLHIEAAGADAIDAHVRDQAPTEQLSLDAVPDPAERAAPTPSARARRAAGSTPAETGAIE